MNWPSARVRDTFIQYFLRNSVHPHTFVPSSSVVPKNDRSLAFVNAGMNQFKDTILGNGRPAHPRVTNTQKCLRINDLQLVGVDTYHHTFFEMLGNWSFSDYFKKEACEMAWELLTKVYKLEPSRLYVTYFGGDASLPADLETLEIWKRIGVPVERIQPFGKENFWAMGPIGPCGPSTEIHYDHREGVMDPTEVNKDSGIVVEIWNLVFMQYNRNAKGELERLPLSHVVDTGAGLERLTAVLNNRVSNYDSDLFTPIFHKIHELTNCPKYNGNFTTEAELDRGYRVFADHIRAVAVSLADGILPHTNYKIRKLIQRSIAVTENNFLQNPKPESVLDFLKETSSSVSSILSGTFPEIKDMKDEIDQILKVETEKYMECVHHGAKAKGHKELPALLTSNFPNLSRISTEDLKHVKTLKAIDGKMSFKWYDSHGVTEEMMEELSYSFGVRFDKDEFQAEMKKVKATFREDVAKQMIEREEVKFIHKVEEFLSSFDPKIKGGVHEAITDPSEKSTVLIEWIFDTNGNNLAEIPSNSQTYVVLTKTSFAPGRECIEPDIGDVFLANDCHLKVTDVKELPSGWIFHLVENKSSMSSAALTAIKKMSLDTERVFGLEMSAQALYFFKHWLKEKYGVVRFDDEHILTDKIKMNVDFLKGSLTENDFIQCHKKLNDYGIPLVLLNKEAKKKGSFVITCATGLLAETATRHGVEVMGCIEEIKNISQGPTKEASIFQDELSSLLDRLNNCLKNPSIHLPYDVTIKAFEIIKDTTKLLAKHNVNQELIRMTNDVANSSEPFIIKSFHSNSEFSSLKKISASAAKKPSLILIYSSQDYIQGRCWIPKDMSSSNLSAEEWMECVLEELGMGTASPPKGQDPKLTVNLKRIHVPGLDNKISKCLEKAEQYVAKSFPTKDQQQI